MDFLETMKLIPYAVIKNIDSSGKCTSKECDWWKCGKRYFNESFNQYIIELLPGMRFFRPSTGETFEVTEKIKINEIHSKKDIYDLLDGFFIHSPSGVGRIFLHTNPIITTEEYPPDYEVKSGGKLREKTSGGCDIISFVKEKFDSPCSQEIDELIKNVGCKETSKILYKMLISRS